MAENKRLKYDTITTEAEVNDNDREESQYIGKQSGLRRNVQAAIYNGPLVKTTHEKNIVNRVHRLIPEEVA